MSVDGLAKLIQPQLNGIFFNIVLSLRVSELDRDLKQYIQLITNFPKSMKISSQSINSISLGLARAFVHPMGCGWS